MLDMSALTEAAPNQSSYRNKVYIQGAIRKQYKVEYN